MISPEAFLRSLLVLLTAILTALRVRDQSEESQLVDVTLQRAGLWSMAMEAQQTLNNPHYTARRYDRTEADLATRNSYQTADDRWPMLTMHNVDYWRRFCRALGRPDWAEDPHFISESLMPQNQTELLGEIDRIFAEHDLAYWADRLDDADVSGHLPPRWMR